ncbi:MAG: protein translocase subunit SecD [Deltaproteobacteria bacterium]|nr:protein translocase subunit SecD [Deltaproteobacteria bacterium]MBW2179887.1 protein translocase subunit SecD [Deltaproteobacteria bacterium]
MKNFSWRPVLVLAVILVALIYILPTVDMIVNKKTEPTLWPKKKINLGLDLQGGMHLVLEVDVDKAVASTIERLSNDLRRQLRKKRIKHKEFTVKPLTIAFIIHDQNELEKFDDILDKEFTGLQKEEKQTPEGAYHIVLGLPDKEVTRIKKNAVDQALETIRNRIDQFGVSEPDIRNQGERRILIQLPGIKDTQRAKDLIGKTALLEFKLVDEIHDLNTALKGSPPPGSEIMYREIEDPDTKRVIKKIPFLIKKRSSLTGEYLKDARVQFDNQTGSALVNLELDSKGARIFAKVTEENVGKRLAIILDNKVHSAPVINERIPGGRARITGQFTTDEAHDLAIVLRAGALPAPVNILEERTVGPSLGVDSINKGLISMIIGGIFVILFMFIYYKGAGLLANFSLLLNIILIAGGLAVFGATLTLPGIAGIILTIGMAVDANVIIFERIREELILGKTPHAAMDAGYDRATLTILDANVTTLIAAMVLFQFGTGSVKGFAVTLSLGVISSLFTALILSRLIFDYFLMKKRVKTLSI